MNKALSYTERESRAANLLRIARSLKFIEAACIGAAIVLPIVVLLPEATLWVAIGVVAGMFGCFVVAERAEYKARQMLGEPVPEDVDAS
jgi:Flp pilus assembly protein TadB